MTSRMVVTTDRKRLFAQSVDIHACTSFGAQVSVLILMEESSVDLESGIDNILIDSAGGSLAVGRLHTERGLYVLGASLMEAGIIALYRLVVAAPRRLEQVAFFGWSFHPERGGYGLTVSAPL